MCVVTFVQHHNFWSIIDLCLPVSIISHAIVPYNLFSPAIVYLSPSSCQFPAILLVRSSHRSDKNKIQKLSIIASHNSRNLHIMSGSLAESVGRGKQTKIVTLVQNYSLDWRPNSWSWKRFYLTDWILKDWDSSKCTNVNSRWSDFRLRSILNNSVQNI